MTTAAGWRPLLPIYLTCLGYGVLALLGQRFKGGDIARANAALTSTYTFGGMVGPPIAGNALEWVGRPGYGLSLAVFYAIAGVGALLALRRPG